MLMADPGLPGERVGIPDTPLGTVPFRERDRRIPGAGSLKDLPVAHGLPRLPLCEGDFATGNPD
jgi:hypothetical protein